MARERVATRRNSGLVVEHERTQGFAGIDRAHLPFGRRVACARIVVSPHERDGEPAALLAPPGKALERAGCTCCRAVQAVAEEYHMLRAAAGEGAIEPFDVLRGRPGRKGNAGAAEARRLAEMEVGDEERVLRRPVDRLLCEKEQPLPRDLAPGHARLARIEKSS